MSKTTGGEWSRGWHLVALTALGLICAPTTVAPYSIGLFIGPLHASFGWSRSAIQGAILFSTGLGVAGGPLAGWLAARFGLRFAITSGVLGIACALLIAALIDGALWELYLAYGLIALLGAGASAVTWSGLIAQSFSKSRGLALGLAHSGTGLSAILTPQLALLGMERGGWRMAYLSLAAYPLLILLPACLLFLPKGRTAGKRAETVTPELSQGVQLRAAVRRRHFWLLGLSTATTYLAIGGIIPNLVPALTDRGMSQRDAASIMTVLGAAIIGGRIFVGLLIDRVWAPLVATLVLLPAGLACLSLMTSLTYSGYAAVAALLGAATGMEFDMLAFLTSRYFGLRDYPRIYGRLHMFVAGAAGAAPLTFGALYDGSGSYRSAFLLSALLLGASAAGLLALGRYPVMPRDEG